MPNDAPKQLQINLVENYSQVKFLEKIRQLALYWQHYQGIKLSIEQGYCLGKTDAYIEQTAHDLYDLEFPRIEEITRLIASLSEPLLRIFAHSPKQIEEAFHYIQINPESWQQEASKRNWWLFTSAETSHFRVLLRLLASLEQEFNIPEIATIKPELIEMQRRVSTYIEYLNFMQHAYFIHSEGDLLNLNIKLGVLPPELSSDSDKTEQKKGVTLPPSYKLLHTETRIHSDFQSQWNDIVELATNHPGKLLRVNNTSHAICIHYQPENRGKLKKGYTLFDANHKNLLFTTEDFQKACNAVYDSLKRNERGSRFNNGYYFIGCQVYAVHPPKPSRENAPEETPPEQERKEADHSVQEVKAQEQKETDDTQRKKALAQLEQDRLKSIENYLNENLGNFQNHAGKTLLFSLIYNQDESALSFALSIKKDLYYAVNVNFPVLQQKERLLYPIHMAIFTRNLRIIACLLRHPELDVTVQDSRKLTALHQSVITQNVNSVKWILACNHSQKFLAMKDATGETALSLAHQYNNKDVINLLQQAESNELKLPALDELIEQELKDFIRSSQSSTQEIQVFLQQMRQSTLPLASRSPSAIIEESSSHSHSKETEIPNFPPGLEETPSNQSHHPTPRKR